MIGVRTKNHRLLAFAALLLGAALAGACPVLAGGKNDKSGLVPKTLKGAVPLDQATHLPSTEEQYRQLKSEIDQTKPVVEDAKQKSESLRAEARTLQQKLVATAARVQQLEEEKVTLDTRIATLTEREASLSRDFDRDRVKVAKLLAILERLQYDMPPVIALKADDALGAAHGAMVLGASLPRVYGAAAALSRNLETLRRTRDELVTRRAESARNAKQLSTARVELDQLLAMKKEEARAATDQYQLLQAHLTDVAGKAADLQSLLDKVATLRRGSDDGASGMVVVTASNDAAPAHLARGSLLRPVVGNLEKGGFDGVGGDRAPGVTFKTEPAAQVVAPADSRVLFAGPYHKTGQVLILATAAGYDLVLAGVGRISVKPGDRLLAGEPVGTMPQTGHGSRLYFELRRDGKGVSPAPWLETELRKANRS